MIQFTVAAHSTCCVWRVAMRTDARRQASERARQRDSERARQRDSELFAPAFVLRSHRRRRRDCSAGHSRASALRLRLRLYVALCGRSPISRRRSDFRELAKRPPRRPQRAPAAAAAAAAAPTRRLEALARSSPAPGARARPPAGASVAAAGRRRSAHSEHACRRECEPRVASSRLIRVSLLVAIGLRCGRECNQASRRQRELNPTQLNSTQPNPTEPNATQRNPNQPTRLQAAARPQVVICTRKRQDKSPRHAANERHAGDRKSERVPAERTSQPEVEAKRKWRRAHSELFWPQSGCWLGWRWPARRSRLESRRRLQRHRLGRRRAPAKREAKE